MGNPQWNHRSVSQTLLSSQEAPHSPPFSLTITSLLCSIIEADITDAPLWPLKIEHDSLNVKELLLNKGAMVN